MMTDAPKPKIIFVYNADSGVFNLLSDMAHKFFSPETYACNLCALTHSNFGMKAEWKRFLETLDNPLEFLHADEFNAKYQFEKVRFPAIFSEKDGALKLRINAETIENCDSIDDLKNSITDKLIAV